MLVSWAQVEAYFQAEYGISGSEMLTMSWRRFRVLFQRGWKVSKPEEFDWRGALDKASGRTPPEKVERMSVDEYMRKVGSG